MSRRPAGRSGRDAVPDPAPWSGPDPDTVLRILEEVRARKDAWASFLVELARLESPSTEPETQRPVQDVLTSALHDVGYRVRRLPGERSGGLLLARPSSPPSGPFQLLLGHCDTVWPLGTLNTMPVVEENGRIRGPGVFDMKGGLTHMILALQVLRDLSLEPAVTPLLLVNSDEEVGSHESTDAIVRMAHRSCRAFVMEPALDPEGKIKTARKGTGRFSVRVTGRSAHAGLDPERGASAIQELALVIQELHGLTQLERGVVVNVGEIRGGVRPNVVAAEATAEVDVRVNSLDDGAWLTDRIRSIGARVPGCHVEIRGGIDRAPLERTPGNRTLWGAARVLGDTMGLALDEGRAGGASDGNITSLSTPTLDGLGAVGDGAHALHEYVDVSRSVERCALLAALLLLPPELPGASEPGTGEGP
jgi:glutamate carboxypeptidase